MLQNHSKIGNKSYLAARMLVASIALISTFGLFVNSAANAGCACRVVKNSANADGECLGFKSPHLAPAADLSQGVAEHCRATGLGKLPRTHPTANLQTSDRAAHPVVVSTECEIAGRTCGNCHARHRSEIIGTSSTRASERGKYSSERELFGFKAFTHSELGIYHIVASGEKAPRGSNVPLFALLKIYLI